VVGSATGTRYRIRRGTAMNIEELAADGCVARRWCFAPEGALATGDVMLAQKVALETFELSALAIANHDGPRGIGFPSRSFLHMDELVWLVLAFASFATLVWSFFSDCILRTGVQIRLAQEQAPMRSPGCRRPGSHCWSLVDQRPRTARRRYKPGCEWALVKRSRRRCSDGGEKMIHAAEYVSIALTFLLLIVWLLCHPSPIAIERAEVEEKGLRLGTRYRIRRDKVMNVHELDRAGNTVAYWCFAPKGHLPMGDVLLAQKIAIETMERETLKAANRNSVH
jgi:hypothetical protein